MPNRLKLNALDTQLMSQLALAGTDQEMIQVLREFRINPRYAAVLKHRIKIKARLMEQYLELYRQVQPKLERIPGLARKALLEGASPGK